MDAAAVRSSWALRRRALTGIVWVFCTAAAARADNTTCAGAIPIVPDGSLHEGVFTVDDQLRWYSLKIKPDRSYAVMIENMSPADVQSQVCTSAPWLGGCGVAFLSVRTATNLQEPATTDETGRIAFKSSDNGNVAAAVHFSVEHCQGTAPANFRVRVEETTLTNPFFTTFSGFETFYRFKNETNQDVSVTLKLRSDAGAVVGNTTFTVPANSTAPTRNTGPGDLNVPDNTAGSAVITHDGNPGAIHVDGFSGNFAVSPPQVLPIKIETARQQR